MTIAIQYAHRVSMCIRMIHCYVHHAIVRACSAGDRHHSSACLVDWQAMCIRMGTVYQRAHPANSTMQPLIYANPAHLRV